MPTTTAERHALSRVCPNCNAQPGEPCTQPTDTGRSKVAWYHSTRVGIPSFTPSAAEIQHQLVSAARARESVLQSARDEITSILQDGDAIYLVERARSRTGLSATFSVFALDDDAVITDITDAVGQVLGKDRAPNTGYLTLPLESGERRAAYRHAYKIADGLGDLFGIGLEWKSL